MGKFPAPWGADVHSKEFLTWGLEVGADWRLTLVVRNAALAKQADCNDAMRPSVPTETGYL